MELESLGLLQRPGLAAGDMLIVASSLLQGRRPWTGPCWTQTRSCSVLAEIRGLALLLNAVVRETIMERQVHFRSSD